MKKILLLLLLTISIGARAQTASALLAGQASPLSSIPSDNFLSIRLAGGVWRIYAYDKYAALDTTNATGKFATKYDVSQRVTNAGLSASLANYVTSASLSTTLNAYATNAVVSSSLSLKYDLSNPSNFINIAQARNGLSVTGSGGSYNATTGVLTIPGYTPAVASVFGRTGIVTAQSGDYNTSQVTENTNLYWTQARFNTAFGNKSTGDLAESTNLYFTTARARSVIVAGDYINYNSTTGVIALNQPTIANTSRTLNSNFTVSTTKFAQVSYSISLSVTNPLLAGNSTASVFLEYSTNGGSSWNPVSQAVNTSAVGVAVAVAINNVQTSVVSGVIPANGLVRLRSTTSGTASVTFVSSQEVVY